MIITKFEMGLTNLILSELLFITIFDILFDQNNKTQVCRILCQRCQNICWQWKTF